MMVGAWFRMGGDAVIRERRWEGMPSPAARKKDDKGFLFLIFWFF